MDLFANELTDLKFRRITLPLAGEDALALEKIASPSSFGNGDETVLDPAYRLAFELKVKWATFEFQSSPELVLDQPGQFASTFDPLHPSHSILKAISDLTTAGPLTADLHKLNVYPTGGFFKSHRDTPRAPNHIGTLLVGLPTAHTGGELVVRHSGASRSFSFESPTETLPWTFLYSDCEHEILPVTSGTRLTLAYDVFSTASSHPAPPLPLSTSFTPLHKSLSASLQSPDFLPDGGRLAIALSHAYPVERLANGSANPDNGQYSKDLPGRLKGSDALIHSTSAELGLPISFRAVYASKAFSEPYVENEADWWDRTANYESEDHRYEAMREAMHQLGAWDTELVPDEHVPADAFASRSETRDGEHQNDYLLTGKSFLGGGNAGGDDRSEWEIIAHDAGAQVEGDLLWVRKPEKDVWTLASTYQAMGNEVRAL